MPIPTAPGVPFGAGRCIRFRGSDDYECESGRRVDFAIRRDCFLSMGPGPGCGQSDEHPRGLLWQQFSVRKPIKPCIAL